MWSIQQSVYTDRGVWVSLIHIVYLCVQVSKTEQRVGLHRYSTLTSSSYSHTNGEEKGKPGHTHCPLCLPEEHFEPAYDKLTHYYDACYCSMWVCPCRMGVANYPRKAKKKEPSIEHVRLLCLTPSLSLSWLPVCLSSSCGSML